MCGVCVEYPKNIHYTFKIDFLTLRQQILLCLCVLDKDFHLGGNVLLEVHGPGHPVLRQHGGTVVLDVVQLVGGGLLPGVDGAQRTVKVGQLLAEGCNLVDLDLEAVANLKLLADSLDLLLDNLFLVLGKGDAHALEVAVDGVEKVGDGCAAGLVDVLALLEILQSGLKVEALLHLLYLLLGFLKLGGNGLVVLGITDPGVLCLSQQCQPLLGLLLGVVPADLNALDMALEELGLVGVLEDALAFVNEVVDNDSLGLQLQQRLFLALDQLVDILDAGRGNVPGGGHHDAVKELDVGLELITIGIALPVEVHHDLGLGDRGDELFVLLDENVQLVGLALALVLGPLGHQDLENLGQPLLDLGPLQVFAEGLGSIVTSCTNLPIKYLLLCFIVY